jgi:hypothetical protein
LTFRVFLGEIPALSLKPRSGVDVRIDDGGIEVKLAGTLGNKIVALGAKEHSTQQGKNTG